MKHWHIKTAGFKPVSHSHPGGHEGHQHKGLEGYGRSKKSIRINYKRLSGRNRQKAQDMGLRDIILPLTTFAIVTRVVPILRP